MLGDLGVLACRIKWLSRHDKVEELGGNGGHGQNGLSGDLSMKGSRISFYRKEPKLFTKDMGHRNRFQTLIDALHL